MAAKELTLKLHGTPEENIRCIDRLTKIYSHNFSFPGFESGMFIDENRIPTSPFNAKYWACRTFFRDRDSNDFLIRMLALAENETGVKIQFQVRDID